jgi:hypothetical protein
MSYISLLLPAFHFNSIDKNEIKKLCSIQFNIKEENFELIDINDKTTNINYVVKFNKSILSLDSIENLIYQRDCNKSFSDKTFESLKLMMDKLSDLQNQIKSYKEKNTEEIKNNLLNDNLKLRELLQNQIEVSENFRLSTEKTLNKIKEDFEMMVKELENMRKNSQKNVNQNENKTFDLHSNRINISMGNKFRLNTNSLDKNNHNNVPKLNFK